MKRFFYDIDKNKIYNCDIDSHVEYYHNSKLKKDFDYYIRFLIANDTLSIRVFYPYKDIDTLNYKDLIKKSRELISLFKKDIVKELKKQKFYFKQVKINVTNEDLKRDLKIYYV